MCNINYDLIICILYIITRFKLRNINTFKSIIMTYKISTSQQLYYDLYLTNKLVNVLDRKITTYISYIHAMNGNSKVDIALSQQTTSPLILSSNI